MQEWESLRKYTSWMRELEFFKDKDEISQDVFDVLLRYPHLRPLYPRPLKLSWIADLVLFGGDFIHFLVQELHKVRLVSHPGSIFLFFHAVSALPMSSVEARCSSVIADGKSRDGIFSLFKTCPKSSTTLDVVCMDQLWDSFWCRTTILPCLRSLDTDQLPSSTFPLSCHVFFPSLHQAKFRGSADPDGSTFDRRPTSLQLWKTVTSSSSAPTVPQPTPPVIKVPFTIINGPPVIQIPPPIPSDHSSSPLYTPPLLMPTDPPIALRHIQRQHTDNGNLTTNTHFNINVQTWQPADPGFPIRPLSSSFLSPSDPPGELISTPALTSNFTDFSDVYDSPSTIPSNSFPAPLSTSAPFFPQRSQESETPAQLYTRTFKSHVFSPHGTLPTTLIVTSTRCTQILTHCPTCLSMCNEQRLSAPSFILPPCTIYAAFVFNFSRRSTPLCFNSIRLRSDSQTHAKESRPTPTSPVTSPPSYSR